MLNPPTPTTAVLVLLSRSGPVHRIARAGATSCGQSAADAAPVRPSQIVVFRLPTCPTCLPANRPVQ